MVILFEDSLGYAPDGEDASVYATAIDSPDFPVVADPEKAILSATTWEGTYLPGKCALTPQMEIIKCYTGHGNDEGLEAIVEHFEASR